MLKHHSYYGKVDLIARIYKMPDLRGEKSEKAEIQGQDELAQETLQAEASYKIQSTDNAC